MNEIQEKIDQTINANPNVDKTETVVEKIETTQKPTHENNLIAMRKKLEAEEYARKQAEQKALDLERRIQNQPARDAVSQPEQEEEFGDPDDVVINKSLQKTAKKFVSRISEADKKIAELEQKLQYLEAKSEIDSLKDFNDVVTDDNVKTFARLYPEEYNTLMANPNLRSKSKMAYNMIKNYGIANAHPLLRNAEIIKAADKKIEENRMKPSTAGSAGYVSSSPLGTLGRYDADGRLNLTEEDRKRINAEVQRKINNTR